MICSPWRTTTTPPLDCFGNLIRGTVGIQKTPSVNSRVVFFVFCAWRSSSPTRGVVDLFNTACLYTLDID